MPYISPYFIDKLEENIDIVRIIGYFVKLKKSGANYVGLSPFTKEKTPSFTVSPTKEIYKDFSSGKGGNAINFLMELNGWSYPEAIEYIAEKMGMPVEYDETEDSQRHQQRNAKRAELQSIMRRVITHYHRAFLALPPDHPAKLEVYGHRGMTFDQVQRWEVGYAPGRGYLYKELADRGLVGPAEDLGLVKDAKDRFWNRVIYPIFDGRSRPVGIAGRDLGGGKVKTAKWINPNDSLLYDKGEILYGLHEARQEISAVRTAYVVEGYNDVIAFQENGLRNTVAASGTAFTREQMRVLRKSANKVILCLDPDAAGQRAAIKAIPELLAMGFIVYVLHLPDCDPDDFVRLYSESIDKYGLAAILNTDGMQRDGFGALMDQLPGDPIERAKEARKLCEVIALIDDEATVDIYAGWLTSVTDFTRAKINKWVKDAKEVPATPLPEKSTEKYVLPDEVQTPLSELMDTIERYRLFQANNRIWIVANDEPPHFFKPVSNFRIEIMQHMADEKHPMKLIRIKNVHNEERIFDLPSAEINTPQSFDKAMTDQGNFFYTGGRNELQKIRAFLYDQMGTGRRIDVLGWQTEGFWAWNNKATSSNGEDIEISEHGTFTVGPTSYYVPSANKIYSNNAFKYEAQKKVQVITSPVTFDAYTTKMLEVHGDHAITGVLFTLASIFQDIVVRELGNFPIVFLYGPASSGKDQLAECCQSFFGHPQTAINLEGGVSTIKAQVREFAQFQNLMSHLSEYKRGDPKLDGVLKGLWDRRGYKRGNIDSHVGTESIPILSSVLMTGNDYPDNEALITRLMVEEMTRTAFTDEETKKFEDLADMTKQGISSITDGLLPFREKVARNFQQKYRMFKSGFSDVVPDAKSRMIGNCSVLGAFYHMLSDELIFPWDHARLTAHLAKITEAQTRKLASASIITKFWDCFLASMRGGREDRLQVRRDFKVESGTLYFNFTNVFNRLQRQWYLQYHEGAPSKMNMLDTLRKDASYIQDKTSERIGESNTSAIMINLSLVPVGQELTNAMEWQLNERSLFDQSDNGSADGDSADTPSLFNEPAGGKPGLPF